MELDIVIYVHSQGVGEAFICKNDLDDIANCIVEQYNKVKYEEVIGSFLNRITSPSLTIESAAIVYAKVFKLIKGHEVIRHADKYDIELWKNEQ